MLRQPMPSNEAMFTGFKYEEPTFSVITPQTGQQYSIRSMHVGQENSIRSSFTTPADITKIVNRVLFDCVVGRPDHIQSYDAFLNNVTMRDRDALIYGLFCATYGSRRKYTVVCDSCNHNQEIMVNLDKMASITNYPYSESMINSYKVAKATTMGLQDPVMEQAAQIDANKKATKKVALGTKKRPTGEEDDDEFSGKSKIQQVNTEEEPQKEDTPVVSNVVEKTDEVAQTGTDELDVLKRRMVVDLPISKVRCVIKCPTLKDEELSMTAHPYSQKDQTDIIQETLMIEKFEQHVPESNAPILSVTQRDDIIIGWNSLSPLDQIEIYDKYYAAFDQYGLVLKSNWDCRSCGKNNDLVLDMTVQLFRMVTTPRSGRAA